MSASRCARGCCFVHNTLVGIGLRDRIKLGAAGKIITAFDIARAMALGADWCNAARGFMFALGCIQSQNCHTDRCPTGVATQDPTRQRALVVPDKIQRVANFHRATVHELAELTAAAGLEHPNQFKPIHISRRVSPSEVVTFADIYPALAERRAAGRHGARRAGPSRGTWPTPIRSAPWPAAEVGANAASAAVADGHLGPAIREEHQRRTGPARQEEEPPMTAPFDVAPLLAPGTPAPALKWNGFPKYNFIGGHNDAEQRAGRRPDRGRNGGAASARAPRSRPTG